MKESVATLVQKLNALQIIQHSGEWSENIPFELFTEYFQDYEEIDYNLDVSTHRWYETSITVLEINGEYMGIEYITNMFSESQDYEDCYHTIEFFEMEQYPTISYRRK